MAFLTLKDLFKVQSEIPYEKSYPSEIKEAYVQSFQVSESFPVSQFFTSGGQSIEVSASASVLSMNIQD